MRRLWVLIGLIFQAGFSQAQIENPGEDEIFKVDEVAEVRLVMSVADKESLLDEDNIWSEDYLPATFRFVNSLMDTTLEFQVGVRLRGNTSRTHPKKSFKIKFKEYEGEKFFDQKKFNLKAENNDPSFSREHFTLYTYRQMGVAAARSHHTEVYINDEYMGLYLNVEQIDDEFVQSRFDDDEGNLFKCSWPATLEDDDQIYDNDTYELETNKDENDRSGLAHFVDVLNNTSDENFATEMEKVLDVDGFIRYLAVEAINGHWDGYSLLKNNFYLYENQKTGLIQFIPYDLDNTFGIDWLGEDWAKRDVMNWANRDETRPLTKRVLSNTQYRQRYKRYLDQLLSTTFTTDHYQPLFDAKKDLLAISVARDTYFPLTFGFTFDDFNAAWTTAGGGHLAYGMHEYVFIRSGTAREQFDYVTGLSDVTLELYPNPVINQELNLVGDIGIKSLLIRDLSGKEVPFDTTKTASGIKIGLPHLKPGIYLLTMPGWSQKFIVK